MVQIFLAKTLISFVIGFTTGQSLVAAMTDSPLEKKTIYILAGSIVMNAIIEMVQSQFFFC